MIRRIKDSLRPTVHTLKSLGTLNTLRCMGKKKIFGIGRNKTGTTSLAKALVELGVIVGKQFWAMEMLHDWANRDFRRIIRYCHTAQAFQDVPFSLPYTYQALDMRFSGSKFILTVRNSPEEWYKSRTSADAKMFGKGEIPTSDDLKRDQSYFIGNRSERHQIIYDTPLDDPYNKDMLIKHYMFHNNSVMNYFRHRPDDLLVLNVAEEGAYQKLCDFIEIKSDKDEFPWENKTADLSEFSTQLFGTDKKEKN